MLGNSSERWGLIQQTLHWLVVALVVAQLLVGMTLAGTPVDDPLWQSLFPVHGTIGLSILIVMVARLVWRVANPVPTLPDSLKPWQKKLAHANHWLLYLMLIGLPLGGYGMVNLYGQPVPFFGWELPQILPENQELAAQVKTLHSLGAAIIVTLAALHIAAALRHGYVLRDGVLQRMAPFMKQSQAEPARPAVRGGAE